MSIRLRTVYGKLEENTNEQDLRDRQWVTGSRLGSKKFALDTKPQGVYMVGASGRIAEAGSTNNIIKLTGHDAKVGDEIVLLTSANNIIERGGTVKEVVDADNIKLDIIFSAAVAAGDTFDIMRSVTPRYSETGETLATVSSAPIEFVLDGVDTQVVEDTVTPANNTPLPVKITSVTGDINITAGDLNVHTSHAGANYDSQRIGDGTNLMAVNASLEAQVRDDDANTTLAAMSAKLPATIGQKTKAASMAVTLASDEDALNLGDITGTISLPTGASTEAKQDDAITQLTALVAKDFATQTTLAAQSAKLPATLGQKARAASLAVTQSTEDQAIQANISTKIDTVAGAVAGTEMQVDIVDINGIATEAKQDDAIVQQTAISGKLPATLGQKAMAASMAVTLASDQTSIPTTKMDVIAHDLHDASSTNITTGAYVELIADIGAISGKKVQIFNGQGTPFYLAVGAAASEADKLIVCPGGFPDGGIEVNLPVNARISAKAIGSDITSGTIIINIMG